MGQVTWRTSDVLIERVRNVAAANGTSMNEFLNRVLTLVTTSDEGDPAAVRMRARLRAAGLLAESESPLPQRPDDEAVSRAQAAAGRGTPVSDIVSSARG